MNTCDATLTLRSAGGSSAEGLQELYAKNDSYTSEKRIDEVNYPANSRFLVDNNGHLVAKKGKERPSSNAGLGGTSFARRR